MTTLFYREREGPGADPGIGIDSETVCRVHEARGRNRPPPQEEAEVAYMLPEKASRSDERLKEMNEER